MRPRVASVKPGSWQPPRSEAARIRLAIIRAEYNSEITRSLEKKCVETLTAAGIAAKNISVFTVPGCFEIPIMAQRLAARKRYDAMIALGAVIRGDTYHFELVVNGCAQGIMEVSLRHNVPIIFEVLATYNRLDALHRAGNNNLNKGIEAAQAALTLLAALSEIKD
jgi:6,7-dimethyl-8-ribityllumazine synthase